ncbi:acyltransferase domain-containing protein, partial [Myxococcota bacterium]|nr:acyltransferase domain-containing protein [Myxococcota bacterium]
MSQPSSPSSAAPSPSPRAPIPVAIVGMGCRFAGADDLQAFWRMTRAGAHAFGPVPPDRWDPATFFDTNPRSTDKSYAPTGAFIADIRTFPAIALGLPPRRVEVMDPQQRLAIELALQAIEDAGLRGRMPYRTGVYMGVTAQEWRNLLNSRIVATMMATGAFGQAPEDPSGILAAVERVVPSRPFTAIGVLGNMMAAAVAQELDLHGPAYTTDAACASAMVAVENAVTHLRTGAVDAALAGGVYLCITPDHHVAFSRIGAMSRSGVCRPFDHRADGFVQGDGGGLLLLKRLADAERDGDRIYAVIHGTATNNDGRGDGPMAPRVGGQVEAIEAAWRDSGLSPERLTYVETHGTGTDVGDAAELTGLRTALHDQVRHAALGSSKANVGHTMSAAAVAGLIRTALSIHHGEIPPMAGFEKHKDDLPIEGSGFWIPREPTPWQDELRLSAVSSFGFGGTNGHAVLSAHAPSTAARRAASLDAHAPELVCISASDVARLRDLAGRTAQAIEEDPAITVAGVARAWARRVPLPARLSLVAKSRQELVAQLRGVSRGERPKGTHLDLATEAPRIAFMYPGQGSQRCGMLGDLRRRFPVVQACLDRMEGALQAELPLPLSHLLYPELRALPVPATQAEAELTDTAVCQPALLSVATALTELLAQVGVKPHVVVGHSLGEFTAAAAAGVLSPEDAARFVARRGRAMDALPGDHGAMAAIMAPREEVEPLLVDGAIVANVNHPRQLVVSGFTPAVEQVVAAAEAAGIKATRLTVSHGFHSPALAGLDPDGLLEGMALRDPAVTVASGIIDRAWRDAEDARRVFREHAISPVEWVRALAQCQEAGADLFLQVGAGGPLASFARGCLQGEHKGVLSLASTDDHDGGASLLEGLGRLWTLGVDLDVRPLCAPAALASLPPSVLPREEYWSVKAEAQLAIKLPGATSRPSTGKVAPAPTEAKAPSPATAPPAPAAGEDTGTQVLKVISKVSAYPLTALKPQMGLLDDLGFDSLMVNDLVAHLKDAFPAVEGIPQEILVNKPTVQDIVDFVVRVGTGPAASHDDDAPLSSWAPCWRPTPLPELPPRPLPAGLRVLAVGPGLEGLLARLPEATVTLATPGDAAAAGPADLVLWAAADTGGEHAAGPSWPDLASPLIAALDRQASLGRSPDLLVLRTPDPWHEALSGVARAAAAEWPQARVKVITRAGPVDPSALRAELASADLTVDVRLGDGPRQVLGLERRAAATPLPVDADDTLVITGGTRGIGA